MKLQHKDYQAITGAVIKKLREEATFWFHMAPISDLGEPSIDMSLEDWIDYFVAGCINGTIYDESNTKPKLLQFL